MLNISFIFEKIILVFCPENMSPCMFALLKKVGYICIIGECEYK